MFEKEFFNSVANLENQKRALKSPSTDDNKFYEQLGFTEEEVRLIADMELYEINNSKSLRNYSSRRFNLENNIMTAEQVKLEIKQFKLNKEGVNE